MKDIIYGTQPRPTSIWTKTKIALVAACVFIAAVGSVSAVIILYRRSNTLRTDFTCVFAEPSRSQEELKKLSAATVDLMNCRVKQFRKLLGIERATVEADSDGFRLSVYTMGDVQPAPFAKEITRRGLVEFRLVADNRMTSEAGNGTAPDGYEWATLSSWQFVEKRAKLQLEEERLLLKKTPELTVHRLVKVSYEKSMARALPFYALTMQFDPTDAEALAKVTGEHLHERLAMVMDGEVLTAARIEQKTDGGLLAVGFRHPTEVKRVAALLTCGASPAAVRIERIERKTKPGQGGRKVTSHQ